MSPTLAASGARQPALLRLRPPSTPRPGRAADARDSCAFESSSSEDEVAPPPQKRPSRYASGSPAGAAAVRRSNATDGRNRTEQAVAEPWATTQFPTIKNVYVNQAGVAVLYPTYTRPESAEARKAAQPFTPSGHFPKQPALVRKVRRTSELTAIVTGQVSAPAIQSDREKRAAPLQYSPRPRETSPSKFLGRQDTSGLRLTPHNPVPGPANLRAVQDRQFRAGSGGRPGFIDTELGPLDGYRYP